MLVDNDAICSFLSMPVVLAAVLQHLVRSPIWC